MKPSNRPDFSSLSKAWNIGLAIVLLTSFGFWLDHKFQTSCAFTVGGAVLGILYSLYVAWETLK